MRIFAKLVRFTAVLLLLPLSAFAREDGAVRRFGLFHFPEDAWRHLPVTESERNQNPNL